MFQPILITWLEIENSPALAPITNQFTHVEWQGVAFWDLIMPLFMFMSGITIPFAMSRYKQGRYSRPSFLFTDSSNVSLFCSY